jgi:hypothetical protein
MLRRNDGSLRLDQALGHLTRLEVLSCAQNWEVEARHLDPYHLMSGSGSPFRIGVGERMTKTAATRIGVALDNGELARH